MNTNLIITPAKVIELAFAGRETISADSIRLSKIDVAQEYFLRPVLGDTLFEQVLGGDHGLFVENFLQPALAHYVRYGVIGELSVQIGDNGAVVYQSEKADNMRNNAQDSVVSVDQKMERIESHSAQSTSNKDSKQTDIKMIDSQQTDNANLEKSSTGTSEETANRTQLQNSTKTANELAEQNDTSSKNLTSQLEVTSLNSSKSTELNDKVVANNSQNDIVSKDNKTIVNQETIAKKTESQQHENTFSELSKIQDNQTKTLDMSQNTGDKKQSTTNDSQQSKLSRTVLRPATDFQRQIIMQRALFDANVLMAKAIRYVRRNPLRFAAYSPEIGLGRGFGLGRIVL